MSELKPCKSSVRKKEERALQAEGPASAKALRQQGMEAIQGGWVLVSRK